MEKWMRYALYGLLLWFFAAIYALWHIDCLSGLLAGMLWRESRRCTAIFGIIGAFLMTARQETDSFAVLFWLPAMLFLGRYAVPRLRGTVFSVWAAALLLGFGGMLTRAGAAWCLGISAEPDWLRQGIGSTISAVLCFPLCIGIRRNRRNAW